MKAKNTAAVATKPKASALVKTKARATAVTKPKRPAVKKAAGAKPTEDAAKKVVEKKAAKAPVIKPPPTEAELTEKLTDEQRAELLKLAVEISACDKDATSATKSNSATFAKKAHACSRVRTMLGDDYRDYMKEKFKYQKSHANRWGLAGAVLAAATPRGVAGLFTSEAHVRPLTTLVTKLIENPHDTGFGEVMDLLEQWQKWSPTLPVTPAWCEAAVQLQRQDHQPNTKPGLKSEAVAKVLQLFKEVQESLPKPLSKKASDSINRFEKEVEIIGRQSTTGIAWTEATWNPLHGCKWKSKGCDYCYAAKLMATRMEHRYPGLAESGTGKLHYLFTGKILLDPKDLAEPLTDKAPKRYFVNSMSDLFHKDVDPEYVNAVFDVMERAWWHQYQILTKRPDRMAEYSQKRYAHRQPPPHIWLGTTTEDQDSFDERIKHLAATKTAVRWLSCEPLLGEIELGDKKQVDWVVVGGESGSKRKMDAAWATSLRDQCKKLGITFFFKQWGDHNEAGEYQKMKKDDFHKLPTIANAVHGDYPMEIDLDAIERRANPKGPAGITETMTGMLGSGPRA